jgi:hypothetical protein
MGTLNMIAIGSGMPEALLEATVGFPALTLAPIVLAAVPFLILGLGALVKPTAWLRRPLLGAAS